MLNTAELVGVGVASVALGYAVARVISRLADWRPAGAICLIAAAPLLPHVPIIGSISLDDILPVLGVLLLMADGPTVRVPTHPLLRVVLGSVIVITLARLLSAFGNADGLTETVAAALVAVGRPLVLLAVAAYVSATAPSDRRQQFVALAVAAVGTIVAVVGLAGFLFALPGDIGIQLPRPLESLYGVCRGRITGTLGLSPNHVGALFVLSLPITLAIAGRAGWRWALVGVLAASIQGAALYLTFTRSSMIMATAVSVVLLLYQRRFLVLAAFLGLTAAILLVAIPVGCDIQPGGAGNQGVGSIVGDRFSDSNDRLALWYSAGMVMLDHPVFGVGVDQLATFIAQHRELYGDTPFGSSTSSAHNTILQAGAETGIAGALATLVLNIALGITGVVLLARGRRAEYAVLGGAGAAILGYLAQGMTNNLLTVPATSVLLALIIGTYAGQVAMRSARRAEPSPEASAL